MTNDKIQDEADQYCRRFAIALIVVILSVIALAEGLVQLKGSPLIALLGLGFAFTVALTPEIANTIDSLFIRFIKKKRKSDSI